MYEILLASRKFIISMIKCVMTKTLCVMYEKMCCISCMKRPGKGVIVRKCVAPEERMRMSSGLHELVVVSECVEACTCGCGVCSRTCESKCTRVLWRPEAYYK